MIDASQIQAFMQEVRYAVNRIYKQVQLIVGRGRSTTAVNDTGVIREVQADLGFNQTVDNMRVVQQYGFASNFPLGTDLIVAFVAGDRSNGCVIGTNNQTYAIKELGDGSVAVYDMWGRSIVLTQNGIVFNSPGVDIKMITPNLRVTGNVIAGDGGSDSVGLQHHVHANGGGIGNSGQPQPGT